MLKFKEKTPEGRLLEITDIYNELFRPGEKWNKSAPDFTSTLKLFDEINYFEYDDSVIEFMLRNDCVKLSVRQMCEIPDIITRGRHSGTPPRPTRNRHEGTPLHLSRGRHAGTPPRPTRPTLDRRGGTKTIKLKRKSKRKSRLISNKKVYKKRTLSKKTFKKKSKKSRKSLK